MNDIIEEVKEDKRILQHHYQKGLWFFSSTHQTLILMSLAFLPQQTKQTQLSPQN